MEIGELAGMRRSDVEHVKALLSRQFDEARPAYGRMRRRQPRTFICVGTTNEDTYLVDETGNRRFLPVRCGVVDVEGLQRDRDQLWAEASTYEKKGEQIWLPKHMQAALAEAQADREVQDEWQGTVQAWLDEKYPMARTLLGDQCRTTILEVLGSALNIQKEKLDALIQKRMIRIMRRCGWEKTIRVNGKNYWERKKGN